MNSSLKENIEFTGGNYKKEILKIVLVNIIFLLAGFSIYYFLRNLTYTIFVGVFLLIINYILLTSYGNKKRIILAQREEEFIVIISYFEVFINNSKNVYQSFRLTLPYCSNWMREKVENFIKQMDTDKSVQPFIDFAHNFTSPIVGNVMLSIFQMIDQGEAVGQMNQFTLLFEQLSKSYQEDLIEKKKSSLDSTNSYPLIGAGGITILVTFCIVSLLGEMLNVL